MSCKKLILPLLCLISYFLIVSAINVSYDGRAITIDGKRRVLISGSIHYPRSTPGMWPDLIKKSKEGGLDIIETYVFWNAHEPQRRHYDFSGNLDIVRFIKAVQAEGMYLNLRIGPYVCAEWNNGGLPVWLQNIPGMEMRTANPAFMSEMQNFTTLIVDMMKKEKLFASQGGNIILAQIENEYGLAENIYGEAGKTYVKWCGELAESLNIGVPWIMCQQPDAPEPIINTCNGFYCDDFEPNRPTSPKMWTENWTGWFKNWASPDPLRTPEDLAFSVARFFQSGGTFQNYYMYHGGTNFGRTNGGGYITTSYDYNAPLDEYGNLNQPKYGHLKQLHDVLHSMEKTLTHGKITNMTFENYTSATIYTTEEGSSCFLANVNETTDAIISFQGANYSVPAWSVSILPDCKTDVYNTARVNTQTTVMVKKSDKDGLGIAPLEWSWRFVELSTPKRSLSGLKKTTGTETDSLPAYRNLTWYKTTFKAPAGTDPVVVDLLGLGKGEAWVNGNSLGRYWPAYIADNWSCPSKTCDYRGTYDAKKCVHNCGNPTQRWYHVPRSFLRDGDNELVIFEQIGGDPTIVSFQTVRAGTVCGNAYENSTLVLSCEGHPITAVKFASFGNPSGSCGSFSRGTCVGEKHALSVIEKECVGKESCSINASEDVFGSSNCGDIVKRLAVEVVC